MSSFHSRRWDGQPETDCDTRFFDLRESGYTGPIDQDGYAVTDGEHTSWPTGPDEGGYAGWDTGPSRVGSVVTWLIAMVVVAAVLYGILH